MRVLSEDNIWVDITAENCRQDKEIMIS